MITYNKGIELKQIVAPVFSEVHRKLNMGEINQIVLKGGRGSAKSSYAAIEVILQLLKDNNIHAVVLRQVAAKMRETVFTQYKWAIRQLGVYNDFKFTTHPLRIEHKDTHQTILFFGADNYEDIKSVKPEVGYFGIIHFEEFHQFNGEKEIRNIQQSVLRGGEKGIIIKSFNPPITKSHWANKYCEKEKPKQIIHSSTYLTTPPKWLGSVFIEEAEWLKQTDPKAYEHEYLGVPVGSGGLVFENLERRTITDEETNRFDRILNGVDWGWFPDVWAFNRCNYDAAQRTLYIFAEEQRNQMGNRETAEIVKKYTCEYNEVVTCDSAEPKSVADYYSYGVNSRKAIKGAGSVEYSMKWLQSLKSIVIDPIRCPHTVKEFTDYEYMKNKHGEIISGYVDKNNHHIDAVRYATERIWTRNGA